MPFVNPASVSSITGSFPTVNLVALPAVIAGGGVGGGVGGAGCGTVVTNVHGKAIGVAPLLAGCV